MKKIGNVVTLFVLLTIFLPAISWAQQHLAPRPIERYFLINYDEAFLTLDNAVARNPQSALALLRRGEFLRLTGKTEQARLDFLMANRLNPYAADLYQFNGPNSLLSILAFQPERATIRLPLNQRINAYYHYIDWQFFLKNQEVVEIDRIEEMVERVDQQAWPAALRGLDSLLQDYPNSAVGYDLKGLVLTKLEDYEGATEAFQEAVSIEPNFAIAWYNFSKLEQQKGNPAQAVTYLDQAIRLQEDLAKAYFDRARLRKQQGDRAGALADYDKVIELGGEDYLEAYLNRGLTRKLLGDFNGALEDLNVAVQEYPDHPELYKNRGNLYLLFGDYESAIEDYNEAIGLRDDFAEAYYNRGLAHLIRYDREAGCADLEKSQGLGYERAAEKQKYFCSKQLDLPLVEW